MKTTFHRDGTITVWDVYTQQWDRTSEPSDRVLASMSHQERRRVLRHCGIGHCKWRGKWYCVEVSPDGMGYSWQIAGPRQTREALDMIADGETSGECKIGGRLIRWYRDR